MNRFQAMSRPQARSLDSVNAFMRGVYNWMAAGLGLTALAAFATASSPDMIQLLYSGSILSWVIIFAPFVLVMILSAGINSMSATTATITFMSYSALMGVSLSSVLLMYTGESVFTTFVICATMFGGMSIYGTTTKRDLTSWGSFLFMGLIGILIASVVNIFLANSVMHWVISVIGVVLFTGLTAYDTQRLRDMGESAPYGDATVLRRGTILGALTLYLDFINLFLMLLRLFGSSRD
ncbi:hypothetical protein GGQ74_002796 [Desulfobaculum xiamenense]|uniref:Modulator of FtsH protease n=1 Tax=Desulfobaculum xiamenense TaxID=995050 RepID=A0A846QRG5_9BACT|nr:Bax inhibitor-1/YccA family protein [Desulfobaculum xiamenense]NJB69102.1 hypothetical protein [Desulfobaculum xiamenense]